MTSIRYYITLLMLVFCMATVHADIVNDEVFHFVTKEDGLSGESVSRIMSDHQGRMWFATSDGVSLYNGKRLVTFKMSGDGSYPNYVYDICESENHAIYVASSKGIFEKRKEDREFHQILKDIVKAEAVCVSKGRVYVGNREGLHVYDGKRVSLVTVGASRVGVENGVRDIVAADDGTIWFLSRYALNSYNPQTAKYHSYVIADKMSKGAALSQMVICQGKFFIGTKNNGLYVYNPKSLTPPYQIDGVGNVITTLQTTTKGEVTVSSDGAGAFLIDGKTLHVKEVYNTKGDRKHRLPSDAVYCFTKDKHGVNWFGFYRFGLCYTYYSAPIFHRYQFDDFTTEGVTVRSFYIGNQVKLIGTNVGLYYIDEAHHNVRLITPELLNGGHIITNIIYFKGLYYIATYDAGLHVLNPQTFVVSQIPNEPLLSTTTISSFAISPDEHLWVGTGEGVFVLDGEGHVVRYTENNSRLCGGVVSGILFDKKGNGWIGSQALSLYVRATKTFENSHFPNGFFNLEPNLVPLRGHDGLIYFSKQTQIYYTNSTMSQYGRLELPEDLVGGTCYGFLDDMRGYFWFATDKGLYRTNYELQNLQHFGYGEGLMCQYINSNGVQMDAQGRIWIATSNGLMEVNLQALDTWQRSKEYSLYLYDMRRGGDLLGFAQEELANDNRHINLTWNLVSEKLSFRLLLQDYARSFGRLYQYQLDGEKEWHGVSDGQDVELTHLMLGVHQLKVRLAGASGTEKAYEISVMPSWLAIFEFSVLIGAVVLLLLWHRYHKNTKVLLEERNEIEGALIEVEREQQQAELESEERRASESEERRGKSEEFNGDASLNAPKYARVKVDEKEFAGIVARMKAYIEEKKCYVNPELKMSDLAEVLGVSSSKLSQVFSLYVKENYYEFINQYRLEEFKRLIDEGEYKKYTLTALSEKCGFKKSSFFSTFRKVEGMTPTEYMKKVKR